MGVKTGGFRGGIRILPWRDVERAVLNALRYRFDQLCKPIKARIQFTKRFHLLMGCGIQKLLKGRWVGAHKGT